MSEATPPEVSRTRRFLRFPLTQMVLAIFATALAVGLVMSLASGIADERARAAWSGVLGALAALLAYGLYVRLVEKRRVSELSHVRALPELGAGLLLGAALVAAVVGILAAVGAYALTGRNAFGTALLLPLAEMTFVGVFEEVLSRGIVLRMTEKLLGSWAALLVSSLLFGLAHLPSSDASFLSVTTAVVAGALFAAAFLATRRLWLCIGAHIGWNYTLGTVFSVAVSGRESRGLLLGELTGAPWLTGGGYGLEGSAVTLVVLTLVGSCLLGVAKRRGHLVAWRGRAL
jgi:uncharacterized protein